MSEPVTQADIYKVANELQVVLSGLIKDIRAEARDEHRELSERFEDVAKTVIDHGERIVRLEERGIAVASAIVGLTPQSLASGDGKAVMTWEDVRRWGMAAALFWVVTQIAGKVFALLKVAFFTPVR